MGTGLSPMRAFRAMSKVFNTIRGDMWGAITATLVGIPGSIAFGIIVFAPLGPDYASIGDELRNERPDIALKFLVGIVREMAKRARVVNAAMTGLRA